MEISKSVFILVLFFISFFTGLTLYFTKENNEVASKVNNNFLYKTNVNNSRHNDLKSNEKSQFLNDRKEFFTYSNKTRNFFLKQTNDHVPGSYKLLFESKCGEIYFDKKLIESLKKDIYNKYSLLVTKITKESFSTIVNQKIKFLTAINEFSIDESDKNKKFSKEQLMLKKTLFYLADVFKFDLMPCLLIKTREMGQFNGYDVILVRSN